MSDQAYFIIADTSVLLSFVCSHNEDYLINFLKGHSLKVPEAIAEEMERKLAEGRFKHGRKQWDILIKSRYMELIHDDLTILRKYILGFTVPTPKSNKNWGEYIAIAHCAYQDDQKRKTALIIDDGEGRELARKRKITRFSSEAIVLRAVKDGKISTRGEARKIWDQLREYDVHIPFEKTTLAEKKWYRR